MGHMTLLRLHDELSNHLKILNYYFDNEIINIISLPYVSALEEEKLSIIINETTDLIKLLEDNMLRRK